MWINEEEDDDGTIGYTIEVSWAPAAAKKNPGGQIPISQTKAPHPCMDVQPVDSPVSPTSMQDTPPFSGDQV